MVTLLKNFGSILAQTFDKIQIRQVEFKIMSSLIYFESKTGCKPKGNGHFAGPGMKLCP